MEFLFNGAVVTDYLTGAEIVHPSLATPARLGGNCYYTRTRIDPAEFFHLVRTCEASKCVSWTPSDVHIGLLRKWLPRYPYLRRVNPELMNKIVPAQEAKTPMVSGRPRHTTQRAQTGLFG